MPQLSTAEIFTLLFVMLGPLKFLGPFVAGTRTLDDAAIRSLAVKATIMAVITVVAGAFVGKTMMENLGISLPALLLAAGVVFFLVSLKLVMAEYEHAPHPEPATPLTRHPGCRPFRWIRIARASDPRLRPAVDRMRRRYRARGFAAPPPPPRLHASAPRTNGSSPAPSA